MQMGAYGHSMGLSGMETFATGSIELGYEVSGSGFTGAKYVEVLASLWVYDSGLGCETFHSQSR